jgi:hypothetical protein
MRGQMIKDLRKLTAKIVQDYPTLGQARFIIGYETGSP